MGCGQAGAELCGACASAFGILTTTHCWGYADPSILLDVLFPLRPRSPAVIAPALQPPAPPASPRAQLLHSAFTPQQSTWGSSQGRTNKPIHKYCIFPSLFLLLPENCAVRQASPSPEGFV